MNVATLPIPPPIEPKQHEKIVLVLAWFRCRLTAIRCEVFSLFSTGATCLVLALWG